MTITIGKVLLVGLTYVFYGVYRLDKQRRRG